MKKSGHRKRKGTLRLSFIGGGKMAEAFVKGLLESGTYKGGQIEVGEPDRRRRDLLAKTYGVRVSEDNVKVVSRADVCVLAVKPQEMAAVLEEVGPHFAANVLVISIAAGISTAWIRERSGKARKIVRAMPNAAALLGESATGLYFRARIGEEAKKIALGIFNAVGETVVVDKEEKLNVVTGLSGSGPAYVFLFLEALTEAGVYLGLSRDVAVRLALQTVRGSVGMAAELNQPFSVLKEIITSPGGTTAAGLKALEEGAVRAAVTKAVEMATRRSEELSL
jgi:pyrroline-5-carboxylate reductase